MPAINLPFQISNGDPLDADAVMADLGAITSTANGSLEMGANVQTAAPPAPITGKDNSPGTSTSGLRSDAQFVIQGVENVTAKPTSGNFLGRLVYITAGGDIGKAFICTDAATPVWVPWANPAATDLVIHAAQHKDGAHDPLADNTITDHMFNAKTTIYTADLASDFTSNISTSAYTTILDLTVTTTHAQTLLVATNLKISNTSGVAQNIAFRILDQHDAAGDTTTPVTIWRTQLMQFGASGGGNDGQVLTASFPYTTPVIGLTRTLRLQAGVASGPAGAASAFNLLQPGTVNGDATACIHALTAMVV